MLDTAANNRVPKSAKNTGRSDGAPSLRRDLADDYTREFVPRRRAINPPTEALEADEDFAPRRSLSGLRFRLRGGIPRSILGRILAGTASLVVLAAMLFGLWTLRGMLMKNPRLVLAASSNVQITGNSHLSRAQLLTVFGEDVDRNILTVPLDQRRAELERLPWVEHATVMRLLPDQIRVAIVERKPIAFVRQGSTIGLVDANGVLLDMAPNSDPDSDATPPLHYSFPVVTGISAQDPLSVRAARMKLFTTFTSALGDDANNLSEVDLSSPEDIKALIPSGGADILVHFGDTSFLHRYQLFQKNLPGWKKDFPKLASADMRYERQVVLEMQPGAAVPVSDAAAAPQTSDAAAPAPAPARPAAKAASKPAKPAKSAPRPVTQHLQTAFDVHPKPTKPQAAPQ